MEHAETQNIYAPPVASLEIDQSQEFNFFTTSTKKLTILFLATFSFYTVYWFYKQWKHQRPTMDKKISPAIRSVFSLFFTHSLFKRVKNNAEEKGIDSKINYSMLATVFVVLQVLTNVLDKLSQQFGTVPVTVAGIAAMAAMLYPIFVVQQQINLINDDSAGESNSDFSLYNYLFIVLGILFWALVGIGVFLPV